MADPEEPDAENSVREAVERSRSGAPAVGRVVRDRFSSDEITHGLLESFDSTVTLAHTVEPDRRERGEQFLRNWAIDHDLEDTDRVVDDTGDIEATIDRLADEHTLVIVGALERGLLGRLLNRSLRLDVLDDLEQSVLLVERPTDRGLLDRLFGR